MRGIAGWTALALAGPRAGGRAGPGRARAVEPGRGAVGRADHRGRRTGAGRRQAPAHHDDRDHASARRPRRSGPPRSRARRRRRRPRPPTTRAASGGDDARARAAAGQATADHDGDDDSRAAPAATSTAPRAERSRPPPRTGPTRAPRTCRRAASRNSDARMPTATAPSTAATHRKPRRPPAPGVDRQDEGGEPREADHERAVAIEPVVGDEDVLGPRPERPDHHEPESGGRDASPRRTRPGLSLTPDS